jgi:hypothetical protein
MNAATCFKLSRVSKGVAGCALTALLAMSAATAQIASGTTGIDATGNAQSEMAACTSGRSQQDRATCITEVKNANAAKRAGKIDNAGGQFRANVLESQDKAACEARVLGYGNPQGSVAGGGVVTEIESVARPGDGSTVLVQPQTRTDAIVVVPAPR